MYNRFSRLKKQKNRQKKWPGRPEVANRWRDREREERGEDVRPEIGRVAADDEVGRARNTAVKLRGDELSQIKIWTTNERRER